MITKKNIGAILTVDEVERIVNFFEVSIWGKDKTIMTHITISLLNKYGLMGIYDNFKAVLEED